EGREFDDNLVPLVVTAEARTAWVLRKRVASVGRISRNARRSWRLRLRFMREYQSYFASTRSACVPASIVGLRLKAIARFDFEKRDQLAASEADPCLIALVTAAFLIVVRQRFAGDDAEAIAEFATRVCLVAQAKLEPSAVAEAVRKAVRRSPSDWQES